MTRYYTQTKLDNQDIDFLQKTKIMMHHDGFKTISISKLIKYSVKKLENEEYNSIIAGMQENNII